MEKKRFFYLKNTLILSVLLFLFISIPPVFASQINQTLTYDGNGNLITGDGKYREYNEFNQLLRVYDGSYPNGTILESYLYHPTEDRILIKYGDYASSTPGDAVVYVNENLEKSYDNLGGTPRTNYTYYTFDENGLVGQITKNSTNATLRTLYYHNDYSGSVSLITNSSGNIVEQTFYDPFGAILAGGDASRYSYEGKEFSSVTDDFDFHFRKYDPSLMIFTQPDSVIYNIYDPQSLNRYSFEKNNPYKYIDEDGKIPQKPFATLQDAWRFGKPEEFYNLQQDLSNEWNSNDYWIEKALVKGIWSIALKPSYKALKSGSEIAARLSYGKDHPFASQDLEESSKEFVFSLSEIAFSMYEFLGIENSALHYMARTDTGLSFFTGKGLLETAYDQMNSLTCSISYDQAKSLTSQLSERSSSSSSSYNSDSSSNQKVSFVDEVKETVNNIVNPVINFFRRIFGQR